MSEVMKEIETILQNYGSQPMTSANYYEDFDTWHSDGNGDGIASPLNGPRYFSLEELQMSTDNFSDYFKIKFGDFPMYMGYLKNGEAVAIARTEERFLRDAEKIKLLFGLHHKNLAGIVGFCFELGEHILVYEYSPKGTLRDLLNGKSDISLSWKERLQIALDSARGLVYLHENANAQIIHRDIKSTNIILDENLNAKVIDFSLSKLISSKKERNDFSEDTSTLVRVETNIVGTRGYLDPEYYMTYEVSEKSDVYSFGVVMLELVTAKDVISNDESGLFHLNLKVRAAIDQNDQEYFGLRDMIDPKILSHAKNFSLRKFVQLASACLEISSSDRPFMSEVVKEIEIMLQNYTTGGTTGAT